MDKQDLKNIFGNEVILDYEYPKPYPAIVEDPAKIKAIILGCDPSNFSDNGKTRELEYVFGIAGYGKKGGYFNKILENLSIIELNLSNIYVQNLCQNYFNAVTKDNANWYQAAMLWVNALKDDLVKQKIHSSIPVLLTAEELLRFLVPKEKQKRELKTYYNNPSIVPISIEDNLLNRPLIPFFRGGHGYYNLNKWPDYATHIKQILNKTANAK
jgi:hypothetical protein